MRKSGSFICGLGGQMTLALEENNGAKGVKKSTHDKGAFGCAYTLLYWRLIVVLILKIISTRYSIDTESLPVIMGSKVVVPSHWRVYF